MAREPSEHKWQWVSNEDVGEPGCRTWRVTPRYGPVGALMGWWRVKVSSGCPLAGAAGGGNDDQHRRRQGVHAREIALRPGREHDDPDRQDDDRDGAAPVPLRRRVRRPVPVRAAADLVSDDDLDHRLRLRGAGAAGGELPDAVRSPRPPRRVLRPRRRSASSRPSSPRSSSPASPARRSPPTSARARSARSSTRCRSSASTRSRTSSCRAFWR